MFEFQPSVSESEALKKITAARSSESAPVDQPENTEVVNVSEDAPIEEEAPLEAQAEDEAPAEIEESGNEEEVQTQESDETEDLYVEYKGREINLKDVEEWESNGLRQADYTRKTQAHAEEVKTFNAEKESFAAKQSELNEKLALVNAMIEEDTPSAETLAEWREYEPEKYIEHTEKMSNRKKLLAETKAELPSKSVDMQKVSAELFANHPEWMDGNVQSAQFKADTQLMTDYASEMGIGQAELATFDAKHYEIMLDAARFKSQKNTKAAIEKKVRKAPVSTKPKAATQTSVQSEIKALDAQVRKYGREQDFVKLRKLKRQLNN